jgi:hypothetical protein
MGAKFLDACLDSHHGGGDVTRLRLGSTSRDAEEANGGGEHSRAEKKEQLDGV